HATTSGSAKRRTQWRQAVLLRRPLARCSTRIYPFALLGLCSKNGLCLGGDTGWADCFGGVTTIADNHENRHSRYNLTVAVTNTLFQTASQASSLLHSLARLLCRVPAVDSVVLRVIRREPCARPFDPVQGGVVNRGGETL